MIASKRTDIDFKENLNELEKKLDEIFKELLSNCKNINSIKKFDNLIISKLDCKGLIPISKSYEGEEMLTLSKIWMILILLKITKEKKQQNDFLSLVNASLTHNLNDYNQYKKFYEEQCEILFSDEEAISRINLNSKFKYKIDNNINHNQLKEYYIYLLYNPKSFQKNFLENFQKITKIFSNEETDNKKKRKNSIKDDDKDEILDENDTDANLKIEKTNNKINRKYESNHLRRNSLIQRRLKYAKKREQRRKLDKIQNKSDKKKAVDIKNEKKGENNDDNLYNLEKINKTKEKKMKKTSQKNKITRYSIKSENEISIEDSDKKEPISKNKCISNKKDRENKKEKKKKYNKTEEIKFKKTKEINNISEKEGKKNNIEKEINRKKQIYPKQPKDEIKRAKNKKEKIEKNSNKKLKLENNEEDYISEDGAINSDLVKLNISESELSEEVSGLDLENNDETQQEMEIRAALEGYLGNEDINYLIQNSKFKEMLNIKSEYNSSEDNESEIYLDDDDYN